MQIYHEILQNWESQFSIRYGIYDPYDSSFWLAGCCTLDGPREFSSTPPCILAGAARFWPDEGRKLRCGTGRNATVVEQPIQREVETPGWRKSWEVCRHPLSLGQGHPSTFKTKSWGQKFVGRIAMPLKKLLRVIGHCGNLNQTFSRVSVFTCSSCWKAESIDLDEHSLKIEQGLARTLWNCMACQLWARMAEWGCKKSKGKGTGATSPNECKLQGQFWDIESRTRKVAAPNTEQSWRDVNGVGQLKINK